MAIYIFNTPNAQAGISGNEHGVKQSLTAKEDLVHRVSAGIKGQEEVV